MCHKIGCIQPILGADHKPYLMGWVADVIIPADIKQPEEEIMIIRKPVGLPRYELGFIVDPFHLSLGHVIGRMSDDLLEIVAEQSANSFKLVVNQKKTCRTNLEEEGIPFLGMIILRGIRRFNRHVERSSEVRFEKLPERFNPPP